MGLLVFLFLLFICAVMLLNPQGRKILLVMFLIVAVPSGLIYLFVTEQSAQAEKDREAQQASESAATTAAAKAACIGPTRIWDAKLESCNDSAAASGVTDVAPAAPPAPDLRQAESAVDELETILPQGGFAGAVSATMNCYAKLKTIFSWPGWDHCASLDEYGLRKFNPSGWAGGQEYFSQNAVKTRELAGLDGNSGYATLNLAFNERDDRIAAIKGIVDQAITSIPTRAAARWATLQSTTAGLSGTQFARLDGPTNLAPKPSFNCARVQSQVLKLICATPTLAKADNDLAAAYQTALAAAPDRAALVASQRQWIKFRNDGAADVDTISASYTARVEALKAMQRPKRSISSDTGLLTGAALPTVQ